MRSPSIARCSAEPRHLKSLCPVGLVLLIIVIGPHTARAGKVDDAVMEYLEELDPEDPSLHPSILLNVVEFGPEALPTLYGIAEDRDVDFVKRVAAIWAIGEIGAPESISVLQQMWAECEEEALCVQVAIALGRLGDLEPLRSLLDSVDIIIVAKAAITLGRLHDKESIARIAPHLDNEAIAPFIAIALAYLKDDRGSELLRGYLNDPIFRDYAAVALAYLGDETVLFELRFAMTNPYDPELRLEAIALIVERDDKGAIPDLEKVAKDDPDPRVKKAAEEALSEFEARKPKKRRR